MSRLSILPFQTAASVFTLYYAQCKFIPRDLFQPYSVNAAPVHICARWLRTYLTQWMWRYEKAQRHTIIIICVVLRFWKVQFHARNAI